MKVLQLPELGTVGRWGNWLMQYVIGRQIAERYGAELQVPPWKGEQYFKLDDNRITNPVPLYRFNPGFDLASEEVVALPMFFTLPGGVADKITRKDCMRILVWRDPLDSVKKEPVVAHLRRGDFVIEPGRPNITREYLIKAIESCGYSNPLIVTEEGGRSYIDDFKTMCRADVLFVFPWSTYSYMASKLNSGTVFATQYDLKSNTLDFKSQTDW